MDDKGLYLTIDRGNTTTKMSLWCGSTPCGFVRLDNAPSMEDLNALTGRKPLRAAIVSSVSTIDDEFLDALARMTQRPVIILGPDTPLPLTNGYATPSTLGPDRLAAAVGAYDIAGPRREILVADLGTAATFDHITADGCFTGGVISPGVSMRLQAQADHTARLPRLDAAPGRRKLFGDATASAMISGAYNGVAAELCYYLSHCSDTCAVIVTGGNAPEIIAITDEPLRSRLTYCRDLTARGLKRILDHNES